MPSRKAYRERLTWDVEFLQILQLIPASVQVTQQLPNNEVAPQDLILRLGSLHANSILKPLWGILRLRKD